MTGNNMKAIHIIPILLLFAAASAAFVWMRSSPDTSSAPERIVLPDEPPPVAVRMVVSATNEAPVEAQVPVQPLEERGDAMLFEIDALQNTPFDEEIVKPFD